MFRKPAAPTRSAVLALLLATGCASTNDRPTLRESFREGTGPTVVMLGGGVYGAAMFAPHARELAGDFDVIRVQTLNVQQAVRGGAMPDDYSISSEAAAVRETLRSLGVEGPVHVIGSSLGAVVALRLATLYPQEVRSLVLFEPPAFWILPEEELQSDPALREMRAVTSGLGPSTAPSDEHLYRFRCILGPCPEIPARGAPERAEWDRSRLAMRGLAAVVRHRENPAAVRELRCPVLLINGTNTVGFHRRINERLAALLAGAQVAQIPGTHAASRSAPREFVEVTRTFLKSAR